MAICSPSTTRSNFVLSRLRAIFFLQRYSHTVPEGGDQIQLYNDVGTIPAFMQGNIDSSTWRVLDTRKIGIDRRKIPLSPTLVLQILKEKGFDVYLVGGCVRDLLLHKVPKDYDIITTAKLVEVRKIFHRCEIVGKRFPICRVHMKGSVVEVSSFETVANQAEEDKELVLPPTLIGCDQKDFVRWTNCMHRDFTVNSLFFNPLAHRIYDYANALPDLWSSKLRTLIPAQLSFQEDCARILRGLRLAARLNFSFSKEAEKAIHKLGSSIQKLAKSRILMEFDYMLSYGAAKPSLQLLHRFHLLDFLLPIQAAHLSRESSKASDENSLMLMELLANLDRLVSCDRPGHCCLWVSLFAFHQALVLHKQEPLVVITFASVLYHGRWKEGVEFAKQHVKGMHMYAPEISNCFDTISDDELGEKVAQLGFHVRDSIDALTQVNDLFETMSNFPEFACSGLVFVPHNLGKHVKQVFQIMHEDVTCLKTNRKNQEIDYEVLGKGNIRETRFVIGNIIVKSLISKLVLPQDEIIKEEKDDPNVLAFQRRTSAHVRIQPAVASTGSVTSKFEMPKRRPVESEEMQEVLYNTNLSDEKIKKNKREFDVTEGIGCVLNKVEEKIDGDQRLRPQLEIIPLLKTSVDNEFDPSMKYQKHDDDDHDGDDEGVVAADFLKILDDLSDEEDDNKTSDDEKLCTLNVDVENEENVKKKNENEVMKQKKRQEESSPGNTDSLFVVVKQETEQESVRVGDKKPYY